MSINIPHPSPRSSLPSASPIHLSSPSSNSWKHIISVAQAFSDRLSQIPHDATPAATNRRWRQRCREKGITNKNKSATEEPTVEDVQDSPVVPPVAPVPSDATNDDTHPKRRRGRPRKSVPSAIVAAKKNLQRIVEISDRQWEQRESGVTNESSVGAISQGEDVSNLRQSTRSSRRRRNVVESSPDDKIIDKPTPSASTDEPVVEEVEADVELHVELHVEPNIEAPPELRTSRKQSTPKNHKPSTLFFFTTLPKPIPPHLAGQNRAHAFSFSIQNITQGRKLPSDRVVMICMRARVRKQKRMREAGITESVIQLPQGSWLKRNMRIMEQRIERINHRKGGGKVDRKADSPAPGPEEPQQQAPIVNEVETSREQIDIEEAEVPVRGRGMKRKRKSN